MAKKEKADAAFERVLVASPTYLEAYLYRARANRLLEKDDVMVKNYEDYVAKTTESLKGKLDSANASLVNNKTSGSNFAAAIVPQVNCHLVAQKVVQCYLCKIRSSQQISSRGIHEHKKNWCHWHSNRWRRRARSQPRHPQGNRTHATGSGVFMLWVCESRASSRWRPAPLQAPARARDRQRDETPAWWWPWRSG